MSTRTTIEALETRLLFTSNLVADYVGVWVSDSTTLNGVTYFMASDREHGYELWKSDGTAAGTRLVRDLTPDGDTVISEFTVVNDIVMFRGDAQGNSDAINIWRTDGTEAGTYPIADLTGNIFRNGTEVVINGRLVFSTKSGEIWSSDGTVEGTEVIGQMEEDGALVACSNGSRALMLGYNEIWSTDGTVEGTFQIPKPVLPGVSEDDTWGYPGHVATIGDQFVFWHGGEWWKTDGTAEGTTLIHDGTLRDGPTIEWNGKLYAIQDNPNGRGELWESDGTAEGTQRVATLSGASASEFIVLGGKMLFQVTTPKEKTELWESDGTTAGTARVTKLEAFGTQRMVAAGGLVFGLGHASDGRLLLWRTDGTAAGTRVVEDVSSTGSWLTQLKVVGDKIAIAPFWPDSPIPARVFDPATMRVTASPRQNAISLSSGGILRVFGTSGDDKIRISRSKGNRDRLLVQLNNITRKFSIEQVERIAVYSYGGADAITIDESFGVIAINSRIWSANGNDTVRTGSGRDQVFGGDGDDNITTGAARDVVSGGAGEDRISTGIGNDTATGDGGADSILGGKGADMISGGGANSGSDWLDGGDGADVIFGNAVYEIFYKGNQDFDPLDDVLLS